MNIKDLASKKRFSATEKEFLKAEAAKFGIKFEDRKNCSNCFQDLALQIYAKQNKKADTQSESEYILKPGADIRFVDSGIRVNEATFTNEIGAMLVRKGLTKYLAKYPKA